MEKELISPCGMYCGLCSSYLAYINNIPKKRSILHCKGCRPRNKQCAYLKKRCSLLMNNKVKYCFECKNYPCDRLKHTDERYKKSFNHSILKNLEMIKKNGEEYFFEYLKTNYKCDRCNGIISVHSNKCFHCDKINSWKD